MSRIPRRFGVLASLLVLLNTAGLLWIRAEVRAGRRKVQIVAAWPATDVDSADRFALVFDEPLVEPEEVGKTLVCSPFVLTPSLGGRWAWAAPERLEFRLDAPLPPGRVFTVRAAADAEARLGHRLGGETEFRFQTRALVLRACELAGVDREQATFELRFNQPVTPSDLLRALEIREVEGRRKLDTNVLTTEPAELLVVRCTRPQTDEIQLTLDAKLAGHNAELPLSLTVARRMKIVPAFVLLRATVEQPALERDVEVTLHFTRELDHKQSLPPVKVTPPIEDLRVRHQYGRLALTGRFESNKRYSATVSEALLSSSGESLGESQSVSFEIPDREPSVRFPLSEGILSPQGNATIEVEAVNLGGLRVYVSRLHANNLVAALHNRRSPEETHRQHPEKTLPLKLPRNQPTKMLLDLRESVGGACGVYNIAVEATDQEWTGDTAIVMLTDLGLTVKTDRGGLLAWVTSLRTAEPVADVAVSALSQNNQVLVRGVTSADGTARLDIPESHPDGPVWLVTAERDGDLSYLLPERRPWVLDDIDQSGRPATDTYDVLLYGERGVYRPGDPVHLTGIIRDAAGEVPPAFPLAVRVTRPDGRKVAELPVARAAGDQGMFHCDYPTREDGQLGTYRFAVTLPGSNEPLGETRLLVEEFVPVRMAVTAEAAQTRFLRGEPPIVNVHARYLFDQAAAGLPLSVTGEYRRMAYRSSRYPQFEFDSVKGKAPWQFPEMAAALDAEGRGEIKLPRPKGQTRGLWEGRVATTVIEPGGRSVSANVAVTVDTADRHIGLRLPAGRVVATDAGSVEVEWILVTSRDEPAMGTIEFSLARVEYDSVVKMVNQRPVWKSIERLSPVSKKKATAKGDDAPLVTKLDVKDAGQYRLQATDRRSRSMTTIDFYACSNPAEMQAIALNRPERLEIVLDKDVYAPGDTAQVLVRSPFPGTMLLTLESDRVVDRRLVTLTGNTAEINLRVPETLRGGAFVGATLVRGIEPTEEKWLPHRAVGLTRLRTDHQAQMLPVKIVAPTAVRPGSSITVQVETPRAVHPGPTRMSAPPAGGALVCKSPPEQFPHQRAVSPDPARLVGREGEAPAEPGLSPSDPGVAPGVGGAACRHWSTRPAASGLAELISWLKSEAARCWTPISRCSVATTQEASSRGVDEGLVDDQDEMDGEELSTVVRRPPATGEASWGADATGPRGGDATDWFFQLVENIKSCVESRDSGEESEWTPPSEAPAIVHLWAVDEGILRTTAYPTPDPWGHFFGQRELEVAGADLFTDLLPDYRRPANMARIGGDSDEEDASLRRSPVSSPRRVPAVVWRTSAPVNADGTLAVQLDLPKITGEIRLMAVVVSGDRYGTAEQPMTLASPLLVEAAWPRFAAPDDCFEVPIKLFNSSGEELTAAFDLEITGPLTIEWPEDSRRVAVASGEPRTVWLPARATAMGLAAVKITARATTAAGGDLVETSEAAFPVRPISPLVAETKFLRLEAGEDTAVELPGEYLPGTGRVTLTVGGRPQVELLPALDQLMEYPYGCVEQTSSRLYALLSAPELLAAAVEGTGRVRQVEEMIQAGLLRLWSMQTRDGGVSYWPGEPYSELWPSAYVGELLLAARRAGHAPEPRFVEELLKYLKANLYAMERGGYGNQHEAENLRAQLCHVLSGFGQPQEGWQARLSERLDRLDLAGRAHLAAAWLETGQKDRARAALPPDTINLTITGSPGSPTASQVHKQAMLLSVLLDLDQDHPWIPVLVRKLEAARTGGCWGTTIENATAIAALARYQASEPKAGTFTGEIVVGDRQRFAFDDRQPTTARFDLDADSVRIVSRGAGEIYAMVQTRGLAASGHLEPFDRGLQVRRRWTDKTGRAIEPAELRVGDVVYVEVTLAAPGQRAGEAVQNIAVVDPLPGGLEVENPALATSLGQDSGFTGEAVPDRVEFRDDRVILFTSAESTERRFRYVLRVVTVGRFAIPPVEASCMYDPGLASRHGGGELGVER